MKDLISYAMSKPSYLKGYCQIQFDPRTFKKTDSMYKSCSFGNIQPAAPTKDTGDD